MTAQLAPQDPSHDAPASDLGFQEELGAYLHSSAFPARQDDLLAILIRNHAPSRLLWRVSRCAPGRTYRSLEALCRDTGPDSS